MQLEEDFQCASNERDHLAAEIAKCNLEKIEELDRHQTNIISLTKERDQLLDVLQGMREEKNQLRSDLNNKDEMVRNCQSGGGLFFCFFFKIIILYISLMRKEDLKIKAWAPLLE